jgi:hypothetical protein
MNRTRVAALLTTVTLASLPWFAVGCGRPRETAPASTATAMAGVAAAIPDTLFAPLEGEPLSIAEARQSAGDGDRVLIHGRIGGRADPFVAGRAVVLLIDESLPLCQGCCDTPWDLCCERPADTLAHSATVQVVDAAGQPLRVSLRGQGGLKPLARVAVAGTVKRESDALFVVVAERISLLAPE